MAKYIGFLRGINVGGHKLIKMDDLREIFLSMGLSNVWTYIQSGNVGFETKEQDIQQLKRKIGNHLQKKLGYQVPVILREFSEIKNMPAQNPFKGYTDNDQIKLYVCFLEKPPDQHPRLPLINEKEGLELIKIIKADAYLISRPLKGRYGFPNNFIEQELGVISTARNWNTVLKIADLNIKKE